MKLEMKDYRFPSSQEYNEAAGLIPELTPFDFNNDDPVNLMLNMRLSAAETNRIFNLSEWDNLLINRLGRLRSTYIYVLVNYNRGFVDDLAKTSYQETINHLLFDYYAEIFYHLFFSVRDTVLQILNVNYSLGIEEDELYYNEFIKAIKSSKNENVDKVLSVLEHFRKETKVASGFRNKFTHRFPINTPDYRTKLSVENGRNTLATGKGDFTLSKTIMKNIDGSLHSLSIFLKELKILMK